MAARSPLTMRFHNWAVVALLAFVLSLTAVSLAVVIGKFSEMAEDSARERFALIARSGAQGMQELIGHAGRQVQAHAHAARNRFEEAGRLNDREMLLAFLSQMDAEESLYSAYFGLESDEFFQVVNVRGNSRVVGALAAPPGTHLAIRRILRSGAGVREESWEFRGEEREVLGVRRGAAEYAPTGRPWYAAARKTPPLAVSEPYTFSSSGALGITVSSPLREGIGVVGADMSLHALRAFLAKVPMTPRSAIVMLDAANRVLASYSRTAEYGLQAVVELAQAGATGQPHLQVLGAWQDRDAASTRIVEVAGEPFVFASYTFNIAPGASFRVGAFAPMSEFSGPIVAARNQVIFVTLAFLLVMLPLAIVGSRRVGRALVALARDSERIMNLDFAGNVERRRSILYEVDTLSEAHGVMKETLRERTTALTVAEQKLASLVHNGIQLSRERDRQKLLRQILLGGKELLNCDAGTMYLKTEGGALAFALRTMEGDLPSFEIPLMDPTTGAPNDKYVSVFVANHNESVAIDDVYAETRFDLSGTRRFAEESGYRTISMLTVPMSPREGEVIGVLQFLNALDPDSGSIIPFPPGLVRFVQALAAQAAVALENQNLLEAQKALMDSMIKLVAGAIDAKSPYTGGHCERVPELATMLADEAAKVTEGPLAEFRFHSEDERREFRIGAWLHDCGKVTTPEYVVDKATKLETIYNRIHEVRTRFEVLLRDAEIECLKSIRAGVSEPEANRRFEKRRAQLVGDFAFVAECNVGGEFMAPERIERLKRIAGETWLRHFDNRLGLSHEETLRHERTPAVPLPAAENLLADKPHHVVPRAAERALDPKYGFKIKVPENLYNFGEVYNLSVGRGTLSEEERYKINEHIIQTIIMLEQLPLPKDLRRVPEYAGTHHETLVGSGYPRRLTKDQLSVPARIMCIADIFEALTASDRPYKKAKTLSESVKILSFFRKDQHIDSDLFELFLRSGVYRRYAERYLTPDQIDEVDIGQYLKA